MVTALPHDGEAVRLNPIAALFALPPGSAAADSTRRDERPLMVRTPAEQWAYAWSLERTAGNGEASMPVVVRLEVRVTEGEVGVGCLNRDQSAFLDERFVGVESGAVTVELVLLSADEASALVVRNTSPNGPSQVQVSEIRCFTFDVDPDMLRTPGLSDPIATPRWSRYYGSPGETLRQRYRARLFESLAGPTVVRWVDGLCVRVLPGDQLSRALYVSGTYEPNTLRVLRSLLADGDIFFDVGANAGVLSLAAAKWIGPGGRVYAFEPSGREYGRLLDNLALSGAVNVTAVPLAVTESVGRASLRVAGSRYGGLNTLGDRFPYEGVETNSIESVETTSLDDFVRRKTPGRVAVIKLDVEGAEAAALRGASGLLREDRPALVIEVVARALEANGSDVTVIEKLLTDAGYEFFAIDDESAALVALERVAGIDEQNIVALPREQRSE
jgi:FkbM family methyltransferase